MSDTGFDAPLPPATFQFLVASLVMQAQIHLGVLHLGRPEESPEPDLPHARHAIDMLAMLQSKTLGHLTVEEHRELENSLTELRFRYVQAVEQAGKAKKAAEPAPGPADEPPPASS